MKITATQFVLLIVLTSVGFARPGNAQELLERRITLKAEDQSLRSIITRIEKLANIRFSYRSAILQGAANVTLDAQNERLATILERLFYPLRVQYEPVGTRQILLSKAETPGTSSTEPVPDQSVQQNPFASISGTVTSKGDGQPLPGVTVVVKGTTAGTTTDAAGKYAINLTGSQNVLVFSYVGYQSQEVMVAAQSVVNVELNADEKSLSEVVVVGYGTQRKSDLTGAISTLRPDDAKRAVTSSVDQLIQGRVAGVVATQSSAAPGGALQIRIRGTNSISGGNDPLYVIDGIPMDPGNNDRSSNRVVNGESDYIGSGNPAVNTLSALNPSDVETITVLKDASATAIYGARGANGVVLITTKRGKAGQSATEFSASYGVQQVAKKWDLLNAREFIALNNDARTNSDPALTPVLDAATNRFDTDWQDALFRPAPVQNYSIAFRGGSDKTRYALSGNYFNQQGIVLGSDLRRYNLRLNLDQTVSRRFRVGTSLSLSRTNSHQVFSDAGNSIVKATLRMVPNQPITYNGIYSNNADDAFNQNLNLNLNRAGIGAQTSPRYFTDLVTNRAVANRMLGNLYGEYTILDGLYFRTSLNADIVDSRGEFYTPTNGTLSSGGGAAQINYSNITNLTIENTLNYSRAFGDHTLSAVVGQTAQQYNFDRVKVMAEGLNDNTTIYNFSGDTRLNNDKYPGAETWTMLSLLGRVNYGYQNKYLLTVSLRADGSSRFGTNHKYGYFPSFSGAWVLSKEAFFSGLNNFMSTAKVRAGYGATGSQEIGLFNSLSTLGDTRAILNNVLASGKDPSRIPNPDLTWEKTSQTNIGLDFGLLRDRFTGSVNYYRKLTDGLLYNRQIPRTSGYGNSTQNIGSVSNRGWELELNSQNTTGDFRWNTGFNVSFNKNRIEKLPGITYEVQGDFLIREGVALGSFYGYRTAGIFQLNEDIAGSAQPLATAGERRYQDTNGDGNITPEDRVILGQTQPKYSLGLTNSFSYRGFDLYVFFQGIQGNRIFNVTKLNLESLDGRTNQSRTVLDRWTPTNPSNTIPKATQQGSKNSAYGSGTNDYFVEDGSYLRLRNVTLGYNLPSALARRLGLSNLRLYVSSENLWTLTRFTGYNPDVTAYDDGAYPNARANTAGLNLSF